MKRKGGIPNRKVQTTHAVVRGMLEAIRQPALLIDTNHRIFDVNESMCNAVGVPRDLLVGGSPEDRLNAESARRIHAEHDQVFQSGQDLESEESVVGRDGRILHFLSRRRLIELDGRPMILMLVEDMTERREIEARNRYLAFHDPLTGLANRALLAERLRYALDRDDGIVPALLVIDLNRFKYVNDMFGHPAGDALLRCFADRLTAVVRGSGTVARMGDDEFAVLLGDGRGERDLAMLCREILAMAAEPIALPAGMVTLGASIGCARAEAGIDADELHRRADMAVYEAKREGRGGYRLFDVVLGEGMRLRRMLEKDLRAAIAAGDQFEVHYQPVVELPGDRLVAMEALVRWRHPERGLLMPGAFIDIAEDTGLIVPLGAWVLAEAARTMAGFADISLAVNLSPVQLRSPGVGAHILAILEGTGLPPSRLQLEITETAMLAIDPEVQQTLAHLRCSGMKLVLDDFGTGYSSLSHLHRLSVDRVKIDRSFVRELMTSPDARAIIQAVLGIGHSLNIGVTAEGVELDSQRNFLHAFGCQVFQGYLFSPPLAHDDAIAFLKQAAQAERYAA